MTAFDMMQRLVGAVHELPGSDHHPAIQWAGLTCGLGHNQPDEVPWCSTWLNLIAMLVGLPRSRSAAARSWLNVGEAIELKDAVTGNDVVILSRGSQAWQGHVGLFAGQVGDVVYVLGGNQSNAITIASFPVADVLGVRRLA